MDSIVKKRTFRARRLLRLRKSCKWPFRRIYVPSSWYQVVTKRNANAIELPTANRLVLSEHISPVFMVLFARLVMYIWLDVFSRIPTVRIWSHAGIQPWMLAQHYQHVEEDKQVFVPRPPLMHQRVPLCLQWPGVVLAGSEGKKQQLIHSISGVSYGNSRWVGHLFSYRVV